MLTLPLPAASLASSITVRLEALAVAAPIRACCSWTWTPWTCTACPAPGRLPSPPGYAPARMHTGGDTACCSLHHLGADAIASMAAPRIFNSPWPHASGRAEVLWQQGPTSFSTAPQRPTPPPGVSRMLMAARGPAACTSSRSLISSCMHATHDAALMPGHQPAHSTTCTPGHGPLYLHAPHQTMPCHDPHMHACATVG